MASNRSKSFAPPRSRLKSKRNAPARCASSAQSRNSTRRRSLRCSPMEDVASGQPSGFALDGADPRKDQPGVGTKALPALPSTTSDLRNGPAKLS